MNILFLDQFTELGGAQRCLLDLVPSIAGRGWKVTAAVPGEGPLAAALRALDVPVEFIDCGPYASGRKTLSDHARFAFDVPRSARAIARSIKRDSIDLIYVNGPRLLPAAAWAARRRIPLLFHCHSYLTLRLVARSLGYSKATLVAACRFVAEPWRSYVAPDRLHIVYNGIADLPMTPRPGARRIGIIGRIAPEKGQAEFLRAARLLHEDVPDCTYVVCGAPLFSDPAYFEEVRVSSAGLPVEFLGWRTDVHTVLANLDLLVVPSSPIDATPRVILEAFASGVPVLAFRSGGIPELISDGHTGFLCDPTPEALARKIRELLSSPLQEIAIAARATFEQNFTLDRYRHQIEKTIEGIYSTSVTVV